MSVMIQIRNVPQPLHRILKARSAMAGKSLSDLILDELVAMAALPSAADLQAHLLTAEPFKMQRSSAELVREDRDAA